MTTQKITKFTSRVNTILIQQKEMVSQSVANHLTTFETIKLEIFTNDKPFSGSVENTIFLTYSNHYHANIGTWMSVGSLKLPHTSYEDRGYIKGVATDLQGFIALRAAKRLYTDFSNSTSIYFPRFNKSANQQSYIATCKNLITKGQADLDAFVLEQSKVLNAKLHELTGCSLLHYLREI